MERKKKKIRGGTPLEAREDSRVRRRCEEAVLDKSLILEAAARGVDGLEDGSKAEAKGKLLEPGDLRGVRVEQAPGSIEPLDRRGVRRQR